MESTKNQKPSLTPRDDAAAPVPLSRASPAAAEHRKCAHADAEEGDRGWFGNGNNCTDQREGFAHNFTWAQTRERKLHDLIEGINYTRLEFEITGRLQRSGASLRGIREPPSVR